jgi:hypothetical protein
MPVVALCLWVASQAAPGAGPKPLASFSVKAAGAPRADVHGVAFTPGGLLAVRSADVPRPFDPWTVSWPATLGVYDPATGKAVASARIKDGGGLVRQAAFAVDPGGAWVAYAEDGHLKYLPLPGKPVPPGGAAVKVAGARADAGVWLDPAGGVAFLHAPGELGPEVREWDFAKRSGRQALRVAADYEFAGAFHLDPRTRQFAVAFSSPDGDRQIDNWTLGEKAAKVSVKTKLRAHALAHSPNGKVLVAAFADASLGWYEAGTGKPVRHGSRLGQFSVASLAFHPGGKYLACGTCDGKGLPNLFLVDAASGEVVAKLAADPHGVAVVAFDAAGDRLAAGGSNGTVTVWDAAALLKLQRD